MANEKVYTGKIGAQELYKRIKRLIPTVDNALDINSYNPISNHAVTEALANFGGFEKVPGTGSDHHPDVATPSNKIIYLVEVPGTPEPDHCKEWIWDISGVSGKWVCIGDTSINLDELVITPVSGEISETTMSVFVADNTYTTFSVPAIIETLIISIDEQAISGNVSRSMFEFTVAEDSILKNVIIQDTDGEICSSFNPMEWPDKCTFQGTVSNGIATVLGYGVEITDPMNPLGLPPRTIRVKFNTSDPTIDERWDASLVESSGGTSVWDITYDSDDWSNLFDHRNDLVAVLGANTSNVTNMSGIFNICSNLTTVAVFDTSRVENMYSAFQGTKITSFEWFDVSSVTNMSCMFRGCSTLESFNEKNTSSLRLTDSMFVGCSSLAEVLMDTSKVSSMEYMFQYCTSLTDGPDIDTSACSNMKQMFEGCSNLESIPEYDTHTVTNMSYMFNMCSNLRTVPDLETEHATDMYMMFNNCSALTEAPDMDTSNVADMRYMFQGCGALKSVPAYDTTSLMECTAMFRATGIESTPDMDFQNIKDLSGLFQGCRRQLMSITCSVVVKMLKVAHWKYILRCLPIPS